MRENITAESIKDDSQEGNKSHEVTSSDANADDDTPPPLEVTKNNTNETLIDEVVKPPNMFPTKETNMNEEDSTTIKNSQSQDNIHGDMPQSVASPGVLDDRPPSITLTQLT